MCTYKFVEERALTYFKSKRMDEELVIRRNVANELIFRFPVFLIKSTPNGGYEYIIEDLNHETDNYKITNSDVMRMMTPEEMENIHLMLNQKYFFDVNVTFHEIKDSLFFDVRISDSRVDRSWYLIENEKIVPLFFLHDGVRAEIANSIFAFKTALFVAFTTSVIFTLIMTLISRTKKYQQNIGANHV